MLIKSSPALSGWEPSSRVDKNGGQKSAAHPTLMAFCYTEYVCWLILIAMSRYRRADIPGATYFFTLVTYRRRQILCDDPVRAALRNAVKIVQSRYPFTIDA
jgi:hypothetical protein